MRVQRGKWIRFKFSLTLLGMLWVQLISSCRGPQPREFTERLEYEYFQEGGPHFRITFVHDSSRFSHGWYEGLEGCGVPGGQPLSLSEETVRDLIRSFHEIDFFSIPRVPKPSSGPWGVTLTYRDDIRIHEVVDYYQDNPKLKRLQEKMRKAVNIEKFVEPTVEVYRELLDAGWDADTIDMRGQTALMCAALNENADFIALLAGHKADVNARDKSGRTALMRAASACKEWNAKALLAVGANPAIIDNDGKTALQAISTPDIDPKCARCRTLLEESLRNTAGKASKKPPM